MKQSERELAAKIRGVQDRYKLLAVLLPPIPPILLAFFVFFHRRKAEREGVDARRLRYGRVPTGSNRHAGACVSLSYHRDTEDTEKKELAMCDLKLIISEMPEFQMTDLQ